MRPTAVIFGCGYWGQCASAKLNADFDVVAYADNNDNLWGGELLGKPVIPPSEIKRYGDATVFICVKSGFAEIAKQLEEMEIPSVIWMDGVCCAYRDTILHPVSFFQPKPYKKSGDTFSVLFVQDAPCGRTDKISSVLKAMGVVTQNAFFIGPSRMPEAYCKQNAFYSFDSLLEFVDNSDFDIVHCSNEPDILANLLLHCNKPVVFDTHDLITARDTKSSFQTYFLEYTANKFAAGNMYVGAYYRDLQIQRYGVAPERCFLLPNLPLEKQLPASIHKKPKLSASDGELHLVYEGGISDNRASNRFMEDLWRTITKANIHIHYYSKQNIDYCKALEQTTPYLHYEGNLAGLELIYDMTQYDIGSLLLNPIDKNADMAYPNKLYEYLAAGLPVISNLTVPLDFLREHRAGGGLDLQGDIQGQLREIAEIRVPDGYLRENKLTMDAWADDILAFYKKIIKCGKVKDK